MRNVLTFLVLCLNSLLYGQTSPSTELRDKAVDEIADVLFETKASGIRNQTKNFENEFGIKMNFRVDEQTLDQLGGLSEYLFKLFQNISSPVNTNVRNITGEFSALDEQVLSDILSYKTYATSDLAKCAIPLKAAEKLDSLVNQNLKHSYVEDVNIVPKSTRELCSNLIYSYRNLLSGKDSCLNYSPALAAAYEQHVFNTRKVRSESWAKDVLDLSKELVLNHEKLTDPNGFSRKLEYNAGSTGVVNLNLSPKDPAGAFFRSLNNSVNDCTREDLESRSRILFKKTNIRYYFFTQTIDDLIPRDSLQLFVEEASKKLLQDYSTQNYIIALWIKMQDPSAKSEMGVLLIKQNGTWLTNADRNFANSNNVGNYTGSTMYKYLNLFRNIPKPLILCYQVAKVNGLLTTTYFERGSKVKGKDQIYYHVFKMDKAFPDLASLYEQIKTSTSGAQSGSEIAKIGSQFRLLFIKAMTHPQLMEAPVHFKELFLQSETDTKLGALKFLKESYGGFYHNDEFDKLIGGHILPDDLNAGTCHAQGSSDVIENILDLSSLLLMPTGLDFIPDALSVCYYVSTEQAGKGMLAAASLFLPGSLSGAKIVVHGADETVAAINAGSKLLLEGSVLNAIHTEHALIASAFNISPTALQGSLLQKINSNLEITRQLLPSSDDAGKFYHAVNQLNPQQRVDFLKKAYDDATFRQVCLTDSKNILKWANIVELIRGVREEDFMKSVPEFLADADLGKRAWGLFKEEKWGELEEFMTARNLNKGYPPNYGAVNLLKMLRGIELKNSRLSRFQNSKDLYGYYATPINNGSTISNLSDVYKERAISEQIEEGTFHVEFQMLENVHSNLELYLGEIMPWFKQKGGGIQVRANIQFGDLEEGKDYIVLARHKFTNGNWIKID